MEKVVLLLALASLIAADTYMHNPRGSNNRLIRNDNTNAVENANRLFNSQNNNKGGYDVGPRVNNRDQMTYYEGSILQIEWTSQHECSPDSTSGRSKAHCNIVLQYMCDPLLRDGSVSDTITLDSASEQDFAQGRHEGYYYYDDCRTRQRNMGLFLADRVQRGDLTGTYADITRQNNNDNRRGFECQEERDYYPYWHPSPWIDIAILTSRPERCDWYRSQSENVLGKNFCNRPYNMYNTEESCPSGEWNVSVPHGMPAPYCGPAQFSRDNHLGNTDNGYMANYNWTIPAYQAGMGQCVLRLRYNISTSDYDDWTADATLNYPNSPVTQDPYVEYGWTNQYVSLAINTNQYGRTFQDRSHSFAIAQRPLTPTCGTIWNLNVRGKRGTIQQVYPAVQYDFVPNRLVINAGDCVHIQWDGSDSQTDDNTQTGQGSERTDRSNICQIASPLNNTCLPLSDVTMWHGMGAGATRFAQDILMLGQTNCQSLASLLLEHFNAATGMSDYTEVNRDAENCMKLNNGMPYNNFGLVPFTQPGVYYYMSTRNNNFGWQSQKGTIVVV